MITVAILINGKPIMARSAVNIGPGIDKTDKYAVDDGTFVLHNPDEGAVPLAIQLLNTIKEPTKPKGKTCKKRKRNQ